MPDATRAERRFLPPRPCTQYTIKKQSIFMLAWLSVSVQGGLNGSLNIFTPQIGGHNFAIWIEQE